jgi:hypothetical protein
MYACLVLLNNIVVSRKISSAFLVALSIAAVLAACSLVTDSNKTLEIVRLKNFGRTSSTKDSIPGSINMSPDLSSSDLMDIVNGAEAIK